MKKRTKMVKRLTAVATLSLSSVVAATAAGETLEQVAGPSLAAQETTIHGGTLVVITYFVLVGLLGAYMIWLMRRQQRLQEEIDTLDQKIDGILQED